MATRDAWIIHDGIHIIDVSPQLCGLFRCDRDFFIGQPIEAIVSDSSMRQLARLRARMIVEHGGDREFHQDYPLRRCDGTTFWAEAITRRQPDGTYKSIIVWQCEY